MSYSFLNFVTFLDSTKRKCYICDINTVKRYLGKLPMQFNLPIGDYLQASKNLQH